MHVCLSICCAGFPTSCPHKKKKGRLSRERKAAEEKVSEEQYLLTHVWASSPCRALPTPATMFITLTSKPLFPAGGGPLKTSYLSSSNPEESWGLVAAAFLCLVLLLPF